MKRNADTSDDAVDGTAKQPRLSTYSPVAAIGHGYPNVTLSGNARAILGNVYGPPEAFLDGADEDARAKLLLRSLYYENMLSRRDQIELRAGSVNSISWIWESEFSDWLNGSASFFWITGLPGCGKSTVMKHLAESSSTASRLSRSGEKWQVTHFFFDFRAGKSLPNSLEGLLRSLLYQLAKKLPGVARVLDDALLDDVTARRSVQQYMDHICDAVQLTGVRVCAFIDGLDEFHGSSIELLNLVEKLEDRASVKICLASRPVHVFNQRLSKYPHVAVHKHNESSIRAYTEASWENACVDPQTPFPNKLTHELVRRACGNFLWARLVIDELLQALLGHGNLTELEGLLETMPNEVQQMYQGILERLPSFHRTEAALLIHLITDAGSRVELRKLYAGYAQIMSKTPLEFSSMPVEVDSDNEARLTALLGGLVDIHTKYRYCVSYKRGSLNCQREQLSEVRLTHETLHAFLSKSDWLEAHLPTSTRTLYPAHVWLNLFMEEIVACDLPMEREREQATDAFAGYTRTLRAGISAGRLTYERRQAELLDFLRGWSRWTQLLPFALEGIFSLVNDKCDLDADISNNLAKAMSSTTILLHCAICSFHNYSGISTSWFAHESCGDLIMRPELLKIMLGDKTTPVENLKLCVALCHGVVGIVEEGITQFPVHTQQTIFNIAWDKCMEGSLDESFIHILKLLVARGSRLDSTHLCSLFLTHEIHRPQAVVELLAAELPRTQLTKHHPKCGGHAAPLHADGVCSFLQHWALWWAPATTMGKNNVRRLLEVLLECGERINEVHSADGAVLHTLFDPTKTPTWPRNRMTKLISAIQAGANLDLIGPFGTMQDYAKNFASAVESRHIVLVTDVCSGSLDEEAVKMVELIEYCAHNDGALPSNIDYYDNFSCS